MRTTTFVVAVLALAAAIAGCGGSDDDSDDAAARGDARTDKLEQVLARGTLVLSTDLEYPPQSYAVKRGRRAAKTKCSPNQLTAGEVAGYDADTGKLVAEKLGVEPCFVTPLWTEITGGDWGDRWDIAYGSGSINADRMKVLYMTQPYYATPAFFYVRRNSNIRDVDDLDGKRIGACASCSHEQYLQDKLEIPGQEIELAVKDPKIVTFDVEDSGLEALAKGKIDAFLCQEPVGEQAVERGLPLRAVRESVFYLYPTGFVDKGSGLASSAFVDRVNRIVRDLHESGELRKVSKEYFGVDYASKAAEFDLASIGQEVK